MSLLFIRVYECMFIAVFCNSYGIRRYLRFIMENRKEESMYVYDYTDV